MDAVTEFLAMGGYAAYVWSALGLTALVLVGLLAATLRTARRREAELRLFRDLEEDRAESDAGPRPAQGPSGSPARTYET